MKNFLLLSLISLALLSCEDDDDRRNRNPFLLDINFSVQLGPTDTGDLQFVNNAVFVPNAGINGVYVIRTGVGLFAWEAADPNHAPRTCSTMTRDGVFLSCQCEDGNTYEMIGGSPTLENTELEFPLLNYRVTEENGTITVFN